MWNKLRGKKALFVFPALGGEWTYCVHSWRAYCREKDEGRRGNGLKGSWVPTEGCVHGDGVGLDREDFKPQW